MENIANFLYEVGMLQKTPRTGFQFLGSGSESVAEHILRTIFIGYTLCKLDPEADEHRTMKMCLFHDLPEARTGDMNYVNKKYVTVHEDKAIKELSETLSFGPDIEKTIEEFNEKKTKEAMIANDADQLALILQLKEYGDLGNKYSNDWISFAMKRLCTDNAKEVAKEIVNTDSSQWWFKDKSDWWINGKYSKKINNE